MTLIDIQINEITSEYYDNEMSLLKRINHEKRMAKSKIYNDFCMNAFFDNYQISKSIRRVRNKVLINFNSVLF